MGFKISISRLHLYVENTYGHNIAQTVSTATAYTCSQAVSL